MKRSAMVPGDRKENDYAERNPDASRCRHFPDAGHRDSGNAMSYDTRSNYFVIECETLDVHEEFTDEKEADMFLKYIGEKCVHGPCDKCSKLPEDPTGNSDPGRRY